MGKTGGIISTSIEEATGMFETGYPYIGLSEKYYDNVASILESKVDGMNCTKGTHWGICRVPEKNCNEINLDFELCFTMNDYNFKIPL